MNVFPPIMEDVLVETYPIYALQDNQSISGSGGLFYTAIDQNFNYYVRRQYKDGRKMERLDGSKAYLIETDEEPMVEIVYSKATKNRFFWSFLDDLEEIRIYVPKDTMVDEFISDMK
jgi:hypothetical protein